MPDSVEPVRPPQDEFRRLMEHARAGRPGAAEEICRLYGGHIRRVVRRRLHQRLRAQYDSLDFLQEVWASFFTAALEKQIFDDPEALVRFLSDLAYNKVADVFRRRFRLQKTNIQVEQSLEDRPRDDRGESQDPPGRGPTPSQVAMAKEQWERLTDGLPERFQLVLEMLRLGHTHAEIAERTGLHPKMIQRLVYKMAQRRDPS